LQCLHRPCTRTFKLLLQEMMSLNIAPRLQLKDKV